MVNMQTESVSPIPNVAKMMLIKWTVKTLHVQSAFDFETVGMWMLESVFSLFSLWMYDISQICFKFETDKSSLQVANSNKYLAFRTQCRLLL